MKFTVFKVKKSDCKKIKDCDSYDEAVELIRELKVTKLTETGWRYVITNKY